MKLIVAAIDFSPAACAAMRRAARLAAACGARLALLHVARHRSAWERLGNATAPHEAMQQAAARIRAEHGIAAEAYLAKGAVPNAIAAFARAAGADLIVLGLGGGLMRKLLGTSTARRVWRSTTVPVLAVAREPRGPYRRILAATDLSPAGEHALRGIAGIAGGARLHLLHVCPPGFEGRLPPGGPDSPARRIHHHHAVRRAARELWHFAHRIGLGSALLELEIGDPAAHIRRRVAQIEADLLVAVPSDRSRLASLIFGSVTARLLAHAGCDTLLLRESARHAACVSATRRMSVSAEVTVRGLRKA